jgi:hypothetical protein
MGTKTAIGNVDQRRSTLTRRHSARGQECRALILRREE